MNKLEALLKHIKQLREEEWTGQLRLNFHKGDLSSALEMKHSIKMGDDGDQLTKIV